ncbi:hypothetical protein NC652_016484 [Populus alba x Populus x berolinensis]|nr:hypothetical protein NC652_016484 [Populus alba x Populus x berolinensis]
MVVALIEALIPKNRQTIEPGHFTIFTAYRWQWIAGFISFVVYMVTTFALYVPDWSFTVDQDRERRRYTVECGMRGHLGPACNGVGYVDREVWGINHLYQYPVWSRLKDHAERLKQWVPMGVILLIVAIILHFTDGEINYLAIVSQTLKNYLCRILKC